MNRKSSTSSSSDSKIVEGEKVLCYHGSLIYEAKCLKIRESEDEPDKVEYFIHYAGWSKKWEEWVGENRILKYTEENIKKQKTLKEQGKGKQKSTPGRKSSITEKDIKDKDSNNSRPCSPAVSVKSNKSNQDSTKDDVDIFEPKPAKARKSSIVAKDSSDSKSKPKDKEKEKDIKEIMKPEEESKKPPVPKYRLYVNLPEVLTRILMNDIHFIQEQQFLTSVPATLTCKQLFDDFILSKGPNKVLEIQWSGLAEFVKGLQVYLDELLGVRLLYRFEKLQYKQVKEKYPNTPLHTLYSPILVLRLLCNLEQILTPQMALTPKGLKLMEEHSKDIINFLVEHHEKYFGPSFYDAATPEYLRMTLK